MVTRLTSLNFDQSLISLVPDDDISDDDNIYTVIVGKNGVGKSRLLSEIAKVSVAADYHPRVIAVSTSPFDKFPSPRKRGGSDASTYRYVGMRSEGMFQASSAVSLISSASKGLLEKLVIGIGGHDLQAVFESLNFHPVAEFVFKPGYLKLGTDEYYDTARIEGTSLAIELRRLDREYGIQVDERYFELLESFHSGRRLEVFNSMVKINEIITRRRAIELKVDFIDSTSTLAGIVADNSYIHALLVLMGAGLMRLMDLRLIKIGYGKLSLKKASSGEQCLLVLILGVAGHIVDGALVLIDEPEISLHPRWQEEFMLPLTSTFSGYKGCQFVVATHSPQVVARLKGAGCYIASLSRRALYRAEEFYEKSADFQLAELFDAPGIMNEYISRVAFNLLAKVKAAKHVDAASANELSRLMAFNQQLDSSDPVRELIQSVERLCQNYAND